MLTLMISSGQTTSQADNTPTRQVRLRPVRKTTTHALTLLHSPKKDSGVEGFPLREWSIEIYLVDAAGNDIPATIFEKATYNLHPSFGDRQRQVVKKPPFSIAEEGWGEFDMTITLTGVAKGGDHTIDHDLNFQSEVYESKHTITFRNPKPDLLKALEESGPTENGAGGKKSAVDTAAKKKKRDKNINMEKLADGLQKLSEDDLLQVVTLIHDNKSADTYTKNDVESKLSLVCHGNRRVANCFLDGEFHVDLYTLPDQLIQQLWDFTGQKTEL